MILTVATTKHQNFVAVVGGSAAGGMEGEDIHSRFDIHEQYEHFLTETNPKKIAARVVDRN
jgi:hypothetical protein